MEHEVMESDVLDWDLEFELFSDEEFEFLEGVDGFLFDLH